MSKIQKFLSGTDDDVFVEMTGTTGKIDYIKLDNKKKNDFEKGKITSVTFEGKDIGHLSKLSLKKSGKDDWRCDWVKVTVPATGHVYEFGFDGRKIGKEPSSGVPKHNVHEMIAQDDGIQQNTSAPEAPGNSGKPTYVSHATITLKPVPAPSKKDRKTSSSSSSSSDDEK